MAAVSPIDISDPTLRFTVKVDGSAISASYPVISVSVSHELNKISLAEITLIDGSVESSDFPISESNDFIPGAEVEITAGYGNDTEESIFTGVVVKQGIRIFDGPSELVVSCKHKAVSLTFGRREEQFSTKTDSAIITGILDAAGLTSTVEATSISQPMVFQKMASNWDFILARAEFNGQVISMDADKVIIGKPSLSSSPALVVEYGNSLIHFKAELNAERQPTGLQVNGWDIATLALINSTAEEPTLNEQGNLSASGLSAKLSQDQLSLTSNAPMTAEELQSWANGNLLRMRLGAIRGEMSFQGNALAKPDTLIELKGVGDRFNGNAYVSAVTHTLSISGWVTLVKFGLETKRAFEKPDFSYPQAAGQLPAINGLQIAVVKQLHEDPDSHFRILVTLPSGATNTDGMWARVSNFYATNGTGAGFLPEVGDEVIVGFLENDPRHPIVLGSLYSSGRPAALTPADSKNYLKSIGTKEKLKIGFDDEKKIITIETPGGNKFTLDDDAGKIELVDKNSNTITMDSGGIKLVSSKDVTITAKGNITLDATGKLNLSAKQDVAVAGMNVNNTAQVGFVAKGNATAEISASGQTTVKGGIVMIN